MTSPGSTIPDEVAVLGAWAPVLPKLHRSKNKFQRSNVGFQARQHLFQRSGKQFQRQKDEFRH